MPLLTDEMLRSFSRYRARVISQQHWSRPLFRLFLPLWSQRSGREFVLLGSVCKTTAGPILTSLRNSFSLSEPSLQRCCPRYHRSHRASEASPKPRTLRTTPNIRRLPRRSGPSFLANPAKVRRLVSRRRRQRPRRALVRAARAAGAARVANITTTTITLANPTREAIRTIRSLVLGVTLWWSQMAVQMEEYEAGALCRGCWLLCCCHW